MSLKFPQNNDLSWKVLPRVERGNDYIYKCPRHSQTSVYHPNYIKFGLAGCSRGSCGSPKNIVINIISARGGKFISMDTPKKSYRTIFICHHGKRCSQLFARLRHGVWCTCKSIQTIVKKKFEIVNCNCKQLGLGTQRGPSFICQHNNFGVSNPNIIKEWSPKNKFSIYDYSHSSKMIAYFNCLRCNSEYSMTLQSKSIGRGCPYCAGQKVNHTNSVQSLRPDLSIEWDPENKLKSYEVTVGSKRMIKWICNKCQHKWVQNVKNRKETGCPKCGRVKADKTKQGDFESFAVRAREKHQNKFDYINDKAFDYHMYSTISVICPVHGITKQTVANHLFSEYGCFKCSFERTESIGSKFIVKFLREFKVEFIQEHKFKDLKLIRQLRIDFWIPSLNLAIEYDGEQHFKIKPDWGGQEELDKIHLRDCMKDIYCKKNKINMIRIPYNINLRKNFYNIFLNAVNIINSGQHLFCSYDHYNKITS